MLRVGTWACSPHPQGHGDTPLEKFCNCLCLFSIHHVIKYFDLHLLWGDWETLMTEGGSFLPPPSLDETLFPQRYDTWHWPPHQTIYWRWRSCNKLAITSVHGLYDIIYVIIRPRVCSPRARPYCLTSIVYGWGMIAQLTKITGGSTQVPGFKLSRFGFTC